MLIVNYRLKTQANEHAVNLCCKLTSIPYCISPVHGEFAEGVEMNNNDEAPNCVMITMAFTAHTSSEGWEQYRMHMTSASSPEFCFHVPGHL